jgi:hypothetical protein
MRYKQQGSMTMYEVIMSAVYYSSRCPKVDIALKLFNTALEGL